MADEELRSKFRGALLGLAVGDALDAPSQANLASLRRARPPIAITSDNPGQQVDEKRASLD